MRAVRRFLAVLLLLVAPVLVLAGPATAATVTAAVPALPGTDCLRPPTPESPVGGVAGWIDPGPASPKGGDPFKKDKDGKAETSLYDVYGYAGTNAVIYDPGCITEKQVWDPDNAVAGWLLSTSDILTAVSRRVARFVMTGDVGKIWDPLQDKARDITGNGLFIPVVGLTVAAAGAYLVWRGQRGDVAGNAKDSLGIGGILAVGALCVTYALTVGATTDKAMTGAFQSIASLASTTGQGSDPGGPVAENLVQNKYNTWAMMTFGGDQKAAEKYGPMLFREAAYTRGEQAAIDKDPASAKQRAEDKKNRYKEAAKQLQDEYPQAYEALAGNYTGQRPGYALIGFGAAAVASVYLILCLIRVLLGMVSVRVGIGLAPAVATVAVMPPFQHVMMKLGGWVAVAVWRGILYAVLYWVFLIGGLNGVMGAENDWHPAMKLLALILVVVAMQSLVKHLGLDSGMHPRWGGRHEKEQNRSDDVEDSVAPSAPRRGGFGSRRRPRVPVPAVTGGPKPRRALGAAPAVVTAGRTVAAGALPVAAAPLVVGQVTVTSTRAAGGAVRGVLEGSSVRAGADRVIPGGVVRRAIGSGRHDSSGSVYRSGSTGRSGNIYTPLPRTVSPKGTPVVANPTRPALPPVTRRVSHQPARKQVSNVYTKG